MSRHLVKVTIALLFLAAALLLWLGSRQSVLPGSTGEQASEDNVVVLPAKANAAALKPLFVTGLEHLPTSLQGTEVDDQLEIDAAGHLKITIAIRRLFDYFLTTVGEEPLTTVTDRIRAYLAHRLAEPARGEAEHIMEGYLGYWKAAGTLRPLQSPNPSRPGMIDLSLLQEQLDQLSALRTEFLNQQVIQAFFADEDSYNQYFIARMRIVQNTALSAANRATQLAALQRQLPAEEQTALQGYAEIQDLQSLTDECKQRSCAPAELRQIRENLVGAAAADRLETLDTEKQAWSQRMSSYFSQRDAILSNQNLSVANRQQQVQSLRGQLFNDTERVRVAALEEIHDSVGKLP